MNLAWLITAPTTGRSPADNPDESTPRGLLAKLWPGWLGWSLVRPLDQTLRPTDRRIEELTKLS